jgi:hypothetical protein
MPHAPVGAKKGIKNQLLRPCQLWFDENIYTYAYILWRFRVAPLITAGSGSLESIYWITRKSKLHIVTTIQLWTLDIQRLNWALLTAWMSTLWVLNLDWLLTIFTQSSEVDSRRTWERSPPFKVLSICLQSVTILILSTINILIVNKEVQIIKYD